MTATLELPKDISLSEGERISLSIEAEAHDGKIIVRTVRVNPPPEPEISTEERAAAVERFLKNWSGALGSYSDQEVDDIRWAAMKEKHGL